MCSDNCGVDCKCNKNETWLAQCVECDTLFNVHVENGNKTFSDDACKCDKKVLYKL